MSPFIGSGKITFWILGSSDGSKTKNPGFGCPKIALIVENTFQIEFDKDDVRRILNRYFKPTQPVGPGDGPSWLTFFGDFKDSLWSLDFFRVESTSLQSHWVMIAKAVFSSLQQRNYQFASHTLPLLWIHKSSLRKDKFFNSVPPMATFDTVDYFLSRIV